MRVVKNLLVYAAAIVIVFTAVPSAIVGWATLSPASFGSVVHAAMDVIDDGYAVTPAPTAVVEAPAPQPAEERGQQVASAQ